MEIKGTVERVEKKHVEKLGKDVWTVLVGGKSYQCWSELKEGQEVPAGATVKPAPEGTSYLPTILIPKGGGQRGGGRPFSPDQQKTMVVAYAKDLAVAMLSKSDKAHTPNDVITLVHTLYDGLMGIINPKEIPF